MNVAARTAAWSGGGWPTPLYTGVTIVGTSATIVDGVMSGFASNSYGLLPFRHDSWTNPWEAVIKFKMPSTPDGSAGLFGGFGPDNGWTPFYQVQVFHYQYFNGIGWPMAYDNSRYLILSGGEEYLVRARWDGATYYVDRYDGAWSTVSYKSSSVAVSANNQQYQIGTNRGMNSPFSGSIDLNYAYIFDSDDLLWEGVPGAYRRVKSLT